MQGHTEVAGGVHMFRTSLVNWYALDIGGKIVLVDAGTPRDWSVLVHFLDRIGRSLADIEAVFVTHAHRDHTGFAEQARTATGATVWIHADDLEAARGGPSGGPEGSVYRHLLRMEMYRHFIGVVRGRARRIIPIHELSACRDGDVLDVPGKPRVLHVPGHTPGSAALHFEKESAVFTGDALVTHNPMTGRAGPQVMPAALNRDTDAAVASLSAIESVPARLVLTGHGEVWALGAAEAVASARRAGRS